jgi:hypothetical protein
MCRTAVERESGCVPLPRVASGRLGLAIGCDSEQPSRGGASRSALGATSRSVLHVATNRRGGMAIDRHERMKSSYARQRDCQASLECASILEAILDRDPRPGPRAIPCATHLAWSRLFLQGGKIRRMPLCSQCGRPAVHGYSVPGQQATLNLCLEHSDLYEAMNERCLQSLQENIDRLDDEANDI